MAFYDKAKPARMNKKDHMEKDARDWSDEGSKYSGTKGGHTSASGYRGKSAGQSAAPRSRSDFRSENTNANRGTSGNSSRPFGSKPAGTGFSGNSRSASYGSKPASAGFNNSSRSGGYGSKPAGSGFNSSSRSVSYGSKPAGAGFNGSRTGNYTGSKPYRNEENNRAPARPQYSMNGDRPQSASRGYQGAQFVADSDNRLSNTNAPRHENTYNHTRPAAPRTNSFSSSPRPAPRAGSFNASPRPVAPSFPSEPENLISGRNPIREALKTGRDIEKLLVANGELSGTAREIVAMAREQHIPVQMVDRSCLDEITRNHQGMLAFASAYRYYDVEDMLSDAEEKHESPFLIILDGVTDPQNLGAIIRSAACVGAHGVIVPERRAVGLVPSAVKASAGAIEHIKVARVGNLNRTLDQLKEKGIWLYAADMHGVDYRKTDFSGPIALVIGSEGEGISRLTLEKCDHRVMLPMTGAVDSLNASVAAGVLMYAAMAHRE